MAGYVICAECGARIKANREHCLRCGEPLRGLEPPAPPRPLHEALGISEGATKLLRVVVALAVVGLVVLMWQLGPQPIVDEIAHPVGAAHVAPPPAAAPAPDTSSDVEPARPLEPVTANDAP